MHLIPEISNSKSGLPQLPMSPSRELEQKVSEEVCKHGGVQILLRIECCILFCVVDSAVLTSWIAIPSFGSDVARPQGPGHEILVNPSTVVPDVRSHQDCMQVSIRCFCA